MELGWVKIRQIDTSLYRDSISNELLHNTKKELSKFKINTQALPNEIVSIIISFLPTIHPLSEMYTQKYKQRLLKQNTIKQHILTSTQLIYPIVKIIVNLINFICIITRYVTWYKTNIHFSDWRKYNAFIIAMLYVPNVKGRGLMSMFIVEMVPEYPAVAPVMMGLIVDCLWGLFVIIAAFPVVVSAGFVYITTGLLAVCVMGMIYYFNYCVFEFIIIKKYPNLRGLEEQKHIAGLVMGFTLILHFVWMTEIVSMMEYFDGKTWGQSYRFGFYGEYCQKSDYFEWNKWSQYPWDIKLLIASWFVF